MVFKSCGTIIVSVLVVLVLVDQTTAACCSSLGKHKVEETPLSSSSSSLHNGKQSIIQSILDDHQSTSMKAVEIKGGEFWMGSDESFYPADNESPAHVEQVAPFVIHSTEVSVGAFAQFVHATSYVTDAEKDGWSFVFEGQLEDQQPADADQVVVGAEWWVKVPKAYWYSPLGSSAYHASASHPVTHVSWNDAQAYCSWVNMRLPTEAEWEYAARGGLDRKLYPWGNDLQGTDGQHKLNIFQGVFPSSNTAEDGYTATAPVQSYEPNAYGLYNTVGNVWEWVSDQFDANSTDNRVLKGGSFMCHSSYCNRYRCSSRTSNSPDSSASHTGFRCASSQTNKNVVL